MKKKKRTWGNADENQADASQNESTLKKMKENAEATGEGVKSPDMDPVPPEKEKEQDKEERKGGFPKKGTS